MSSAAQRQDTPSTRGGLFVADLKLRRRDADLDPVCDGYEHVGDRHGQRSLELCGADPNSAPVTDDLLDKLKFSFCLPAELAYRTPLAARRA